MAMEDIPYVYKTESTYICQIFTLSPPSPVSEEEGPVKASLTILNLIAVIFTALGIFYSIWKLYR